MVRKEIYSPFQINIMCITDKKEGYAEGYVYP